MSMSADAGYVADGLPYHSLPLNQRGERGHEWACRLNRDVSLFNEIRDEEKVVWRSSFFKTIAVGYLSDGGLGSADVAVVLSALP